MSARTNRRLRRGGVLALGAAALTLNATAQAESAFGPTHGNVERIEPPDSKPRGADGVYGRFNGDLSLSLGAGLDVDFAQERLRPLVIGDLVVYQTLGIYTSFRQAVQEDDETEQALSLGLQVSPLFLWRWSKAWEKGPAFWDLTLDSVTLSGGVAFARQDDSGLFDEPSAELGLGFGVPLMGQANGLWLRTRGQVTPGEDTGMSAFVWVSWQGFVHAGLLATDK